MSEKVLEVKNLTKIFPAKGMFSTKRKKTKAVDNVSFNIKEGEIVGLLGPNGAGKTTTIQMLLSTLTPTSGEIIYFGKDFGTHREETLKKVNFCSSYIRLPWRMTVYENLDVIARLYEVKSRRKRITKLLKAFKIEKFINRSMADLSAGQTMRVILAKSFVNYPKIILLDEPTASLDPDIANKVRDFLVREQKVYGVSMLFTSHNMAEVEKLCDRVVFLNKGKILDEDTPSGLAKRIEVSRVDLLIEDRINKALETCAKNGWHAGYDEPYLKVEIKETEIPMLLSTLGSEKIGYSEISIDKPDLEDYFLKIAQEGKI